MGKQRGCTDGLQAMQQIAMNEQLLRTDINTINLIAQMHVATGTYMRRQKCKQNQRGRNVTNSDHSKCHPKQPPYRKMAVQPAICAAFASR